MTKQQQLRMHDVILMYENTTALEIDNQSQKTSHLMYMW